MTEQTKEKTAKKCSQLRGEMSEIIYTRPSLSAEATKAYEVSDEAAGGRQVT